MLKRYNDISKAYKIPRNELIKGVKLIMSNTNFSFKEDYYLQINGLPIGGFWSTIFSDIVIDDLKSSCLNKLDFTPLVY